MRHFSSLALLCAPYAATCQMTGMLGDAMAIMNNPPGAMYTAMLKGGPGSMVMGQVVAMSGPGGKGVMFNLTLMGLPMIGGPYSTSRHTAPKNNNTQLTHTPRLSPPRSARGHER